MRITTLLIGIQACFATVLLAGTIKAQTISLDVEKANVKQVFINIEKQANVTFVYNNQTLQGLPNISIKATNKSLDEILKSISSKVPLQFRQFGNVIGVSREKLKERVKEQAPEKAANTDIPLIDITGKVLNEQGRPLAGASVKLKDGSQSTSTDQNGLFHLTNVKDNAIFIVTFIGYQPKEIKATSSSTTLVITLETNVSKLDEVVIIPYGTTTERLNTGAISVVNSHDIENEPVANPLEVLEGRVPGLVVTQSSGLPGSAFTLTIRGRTSIENTSDPLYLIDGVPFNGNSLDLIGDGFGPTSQNPFNSISPADIESIEVLKDAAATAIYGSRGANGVILITTKKGKAGKTKVTGSLYSGDGQVTRTENFLNTSQYLAMRKEGFKNDGATPDASSAPDLFSWDTTRYINWKKLLIGGTAKTTDAQASITGGNELTQFVVGANYHRQTTVFPGDLADSRANVHFNLTHTSADKKFTLTFSASYSNDVNNLISTDLTQFINTPPDAPVPYNAYGKLNWSEAGVSYNNPLSYLFQPYTGITDNLISNAVLQYKILPDLSIRTNLGYTNTALNQTQLFPVDSQNPDNAPVSSAVFGNNNSKTWIIEPQAEYKKTFGKHSIDALIGGSWEQDLTSGILTNASNYSSDALLGSPSAAGTVTATSNYNQYRYQAGFGRLSYNYGDEYLIDLTGRRDGSSRFGPGKQFANFGAVGAAWIFTQTDWMKNNISFLSFGKLRGSYGVTGNDKIGDYKYLSTYYSTTNPYQGVSGLIPNTLSNPNYAWEINKKIEAALDLGLFKDRVMITTDYFRNRSSNELVNYTLPDQTGFGSILQNFPAVVQNAGWEFQITSTNIKSSSFKWTSSFNLSIERNKLLSFPGLATSTYSQQYVVGQPLDIHKLLNYTGVDPQTGIYQFNGTTLPGDQTAIVNTDPQFYGGFQNTFNYKGFQLVIFFQFVKQVARNYYGTLSANNPPGTMYNQPDFVLSRWQNPGNVSTVQQFTSGNGNGNAAIAYYYYTDYSNAVYSDASFIRLKNAALSYNLPAKWVKKIGADNLRIYFQGQNLLTLTKYKGNDPESGSVSNDQLPLLRVITAGLQFTY